MNLLPQPATLHLRLPSPILDFDSDENVAPKKDPLPLLYIAGLPITTKTKTTKKENILPNTPTCILAPHPHARLFMTGLSLRPKFSTYLERGSPWGNLGPRPRQLLPSGFFFLDFFFGDWSLRTGPPPSPRVEFHSASSYSCVNYT